jgi:hypothetical protein
MSSLTVSMEDRPPFAPGDVAYDPEYPGRRIVVIRCYVAGGPQRARWIVSEINADTHEADRLVRSGEKVGLPEAEESLRE